MKTCPFCLILILATPALAAINQVQSKANWSGGATSCAVQFNFGTTTNNLVVVWTLWTSTSALASVSDNTALDVFASAVGPTLQSASNTSAQIFYAKNIHGTTNPITVSFSGGSATSTGCVAVEYSGADLNYPLDSASAGYSTALNPTGLLDSGTVAPANANLLLFGGGTTDYIAALPAHGSGFTAIQSTFGSITEQMIVSGNNTLQRATATSSSGNWVMQMAVFRDASWTVSGA